MGILSRIINRFSSTAAEICDNPIYWSKFSVLALIGSGKKKIGGQIPCIISSWDISCVGEIIREFARLCLMSCNKSRTEFWTSLNPEAIKDVEIIRVYSCDIITLLSTAFLNTSRLLLIDENFGSVCSRVVLRIPTVVSKIEV